MNDNDAECDTVNCVLVGDSAVGKTSLILSYAQDTFNIQYVSTVFDHFTCEILVYGQPTKLEIWDISGREEHHSLRKFALSKAQIIIVCFSLKDSQSLTNVTQKWLKEIKNDEKYNQLPLILVATKGDQLWDQDTLQVDKGANSRSYNATMEQAAQIAKQEGFTKLITTSSLFGDHVKSVFDEAVYQVLNRQGQTSALINERENNNEEKTFKGDVKDKKCLIF